MSIDFKAIIFEKQNAFAKNLLTNPMFAHLTLEQASDLVSTIGRTYTATRCAMEIVPAPLLAPKENQMLAEIMSDIMATVSDVLFKLYVPKAYALDLSEEENLMYGMGLSEVTGQIIAMAIEFSKMYDVEQGGTSAIVLPS